MISVMARVPGPLSLIAVAACASLAAAGEPARLLQGSVSRAGACLRVADGRAWELRSGGQRLRLPVRRGESLEEMIEFDGGWAAAGVRLSPHGDGLLVLVDGPAGVERLRPIPEPSARLRVRPVPLASGSAFEGLAWLEGDGPDGYGVRAADWTGAVWDPPVEVAAASRGGQAGLVGAVLEDGSWLLVWSASDGHDSELVWSRRRGSGWSEPRRLTAPNRVPDITPTLLAVPGGAILTWARLDGGLYRLYSARFHGGSWSAARSLATEGTSPRLVELAGAGRFLLARSATGWAVLEVDDGGAIRRRAAVAMDRSEPPVLSVAGGGLSLRWGDSRPQPLDWRGPLR